MCASSTAATSLHEKPEDGVCKDLHVFVTCCVISEVVVHEVDYTSSFCSLTLVYYLGFFHFLHSGNTGYIHEQGGYLRQPAVSELIW